MSEVKFDRSDVIAAFSLGAKALGMAGRRFNRVLAKQTREDFALLTGASDPDGSPVPFSVCVAVALSWLSPGPRAGKQTHAKKLYDFIATRPSEKKIGTYTHPKKYPVQMGMRFWVPHINAEGMDWVAGPKDLRPIHDEDIVKSSSGSAVRWSVLAPIKVCALVNRWSKDSVNEFVTPIGLQVRRGLKDVLGLVVPTPENASGHMNAWAQQLRLAELADCSVEDINSGLWEVGDTAGEDDPDDE